MIYTRKSVFGNEMQEIKTDLSDFEVLSKLNPVVMQPSADKEQFKKKEAFYFVAGKFNKDENGKFIRNDESLEYRSLVAIDYEHAPEKNTPLASEDISADDFKQLVKASLSDFNYIMYKTINHTPEKPRMRLIVEPAKNIRSKEEYEALIAEINSKIESSHADDTFKLNYDTSSATFSQMQGLPITDNPENYKIITNKGVKYPVSLSLLENTKKPVRANIEAFTRTGETIEHNNAIAMLTNYIKNEAGNLSEREYYLPAKQMIGKAVVTGQIEYDTALECIELLAMGDTQMEKNNVNELHRELKLSKGNENYFKVQGDFSSKFGYYDRQELKINHTDLAEAPKAVPEKSEEELKAEYLANSAGNGVKAFFNGISEAIDTPAVPTGFEKLDMLLDDGLYAGLYIIGAISSLGKTTLTMQIADQIAEQGNDVLFFSLEMDKKEIMAKSISRTTYINDKDNAKSMRDITAGKRYATYAPEEKQLILTSATQYADYTKDRLYIFEGIGDIGVMNIKKTVEDHIKYTGNTPVVFIDYLQILAPFDMRATDKQNTDKAVLELKRLSRDYGIPVFAISSFNRANYTTSVSMSSFKESGAIEYSSDVLLGIQFTKQREIDKANAAKKPNEARLILDIDVEKSKSPRELEVKILKNRNGITGKSVDFNYYPRFNYFEEKGLPPFIETDYNGKEYERPIETLKELYEKPQGKQEAFKFSYDI